MNQFVETEENVFADEVAFGALGGLVGAVAFGVVLQAFVPATFETVIPMVYGLAGVTVFVGWLLHLGFGVAFGILYALVANVRPISCYAGRITTGPVVGFGYGVSLWVIGWAVLLPLWLSIADAPDAPPFPNLEVLSLVGHALYGATLGMIYSGSWPRYAHDSASATP